MRLMVKNIFITLMAFFVQAPAVSAHPINGAAALSLPSIPKDGTILAFGDSLTFGTGTTQQYSYPAVLAGAIEREVINAGVPGELSTEGEPRLRQLLNSGIQPDLLILCHGGNDLLKNQDLNKTVNALHAMINMAKTRGIPVVLIGVPRPVMPLKTADFYYRVARAQNIPLEDNILSEILADDQYKSDLTHPNQIGYRALAGAIYLLLRRHGAVE